MALLCLAAGCNNPLSEDLGEPDEQTRRDIEKCGITEPAPGLAAPPGSYVDQGLTIDYARMGGEDYAEKIVKDPRMVEQVYVDAVGGNALARWYVCLFEAGSRGVARAVARKLAGLGCQTIASCSFHSKNLPYSDTTASGVRILTVIADDFEAEAQRLQVIQEILAHGLALFVGTRIMSARVRAGPAMTVSQSTTTMPRPTAKPGASRPAMSELTEAELSGVRGGSPARRTPTAGGVAAVSKPAYKPFTRANFRANLAQRTGGIPDNAQAHHVLPVRFEKECRKAGINIHDPKFGTWWKGSDHQSKARAYNNEWNEFLKNSNPTREAILQKGRDMAKEYGLAIGF